MTSCDARTSSATRVLRRRTRLTALALLLLGIATTTAAEDGAAPGWTEIPDTAFKALCPDPAQHPGIRGASGCAAVTAAWNSGVLDTKRNRLVFWGGGHNDYYGNEIYAYDIGTRRMLRIKEPASPGTDFQHCSDAIGNPPEANSRHTYAGLAYIESTDQMFLFNGSTACGASDKYGTTWLYDFATNTWTLKHPTGRQPADGRSAKSVIPVAAYDAATDKVYVDAIDLYAYDPHTDHYEYFPESHDSRQGYHNNGVIDPKRHKFLLFGTGDSKIIDITAGAPHRTLPFDATGATGIVDTDYPGLAYDPTIDRIVAWNGGDTVYTLDVERKLWSARIYPGGPEAVRNGTFGRFVYSRPTGVFVEVSRWDDNVHTLRLADPAADAASDRDFEPPLVAIAAPRPDAPIGGRIEVSARASDNRGVPAVQFLLDGSPFGTPLAAPPYAATLDTTLLADGTHVLSASAADTAGNRAKASPVALRVDNRRAAARGDLHVDLPCGVLPAITITRSGTVIDGHGCATVSGLAAPNRLGSVHIPEGVNDVSLRNLRITLGSEDLLEANKACLRPQGTGLTLENVELAAPCGDGALSGRDSGTWTVRNSHLDRAGGRSNEGHGIYHCSFNCRPGEGRLVIEHSTLLDCRYATGANGEAVKTRGAAVEISDSVLGAVAPESRCDKAVSLPNGGGGRIVDSVLLSGPSSDSDVPIGYGAETRCPAGGRVATKAGESGRRLCVHDGEAVPPDYVLTNEHPGDLLIERSLIVCDRKRGACRFAVQGPHTLTIKDSMVVGFRKQTDTQFFAGVDGGKIAFENTRFCATRAECGLPAWPALPRAPRP